MPTTSSTPLPDPAPPTHPVVVRNLCKVFNDLWGRPKAVAVQNVDFDVHRGEVFGLLGPNGSGKSTTIKILLGLLHPTSGHVEILGQHPRSVAAKYRIGYLPEEACLYRFLSATETLHIYGRIFGIPSPERHSRIQQLLDMVGLANARSRLVGEFSKGMLRRLGIAQALLNDPDLVFLDEPTAGLDPLGCREIKDLILTLAQRGKTVILSSHLLADVEDLCNRVVIYYGGKVQAIGPLQDLLATPDSLQITTPPLSRPLLQDVLALLQRESLPDQIRVRVPTQSLERFFIQTVSKAQAAATATSGATQSAGIASFLKSGPQDPAAPSADRILERLTLAPSPPPPESQAAPSSAQPLPAPPPKPTLHPALESLTTPDPPTTPSPLVPSPATTPALAAPTSSAPTPVKLSDASDSKLAALLNPNPENHP